MTELRGATHLGQAIHVDAKRKLTLVINTAWPVATGRVPSMPQAPFFHAAAQANDAESARR